MCKPETVYLNGNPISEATFLYSEILCNFTVNPSL
jgi:hypothetical protein